jgi:hypothetical protein
MLALKWEYIAIILYLLPAWEVHAAARILADMQVAQKSERMRPRRGSSRR